MLVQMRTALAAQRAERLLVGHGITIVALGGEGLEEVGHRDDARTEWNLLAPEFLSLSLATLTHSTVGRSSL